MATVDEILKKGNVKQEDFEQLSDGQKKFIENVLTQNTTKKPKQLLEEYFEQSTTVPDSLSKVPQEVIDRTERNTEIMKSLILGEPFKDKSGKLAETLKSAQISRKEFLSLDETQQKFVKNELMGDIKGKSPDELWNTYFNMRGETENPNPPKTITEEKWNAYFNARGKTDKPAPQMATEAEQQQKEKANEETLMRIMRARLANSQKR